MKRVALAACLCAAIGFAHAAEVTLKSTWMRPALQGAQTARVYVDIVSDANVTLVGASTPIARKVAIVHVKTIGDPATEQVVKAFAVPGGTTTRLAYLGDHLRLVDIKRTVVNGDPVPIKLTFKDSGGKRFDVAGNVVVRGILVPHPDK